MIVSKNSRLQPLPTSSIHGWVLVVRDCLVLPVYLFTIIALIFGDGEKVCMGMVYRVGPTQPYKTIGQVVGGIALKAGDEVWIDSKPTPYYEKFVINNKGTSAAPIIIKGIPDSAGALPIIDGSGAVTSLELDYWGETRNLVKIGAANIPGEGAEYIRIEKLHLRNAKAGLNFIDDQGSQASYVSNAACIHVEEGQNIQIMYNTITGCGNGIFVTPGVKNVTIEGNYIYGNGNEGSIYEHNVYNEAIGITYRYNRFGPLCTGCLGNNIKERSSGVVIAYNMIEGGNRQIDLVDSVESPIFDSPNYQTTFVYGNIMVEREGTDNRQIIHYGGDSGEEQYYRKGTLIMYHNTIVSTRIGRTTFIRLSTLSESCKAYNNIIYVTAAGNQLELLAEQTGSLDLRSNWIKDGFVNAFDPIESGTVTILGTVGGVSPGFADVNFATSLDCRLGKALLPSSSLGVGWPKVEQEYKLHTSFQARNGSDIGAYQYKPPIPPTPPTPRPPSIPISPTANVPTKPAPTKPVPTFPTPTKPAPTKPAPTKPAPTKPAPTKPAPTKPAPTKPAPTKLPPTKPAPTKPAPTKPAPIKLPPTKPAPTKPAPTKLPPTNRRPRNPVPTKLTPIKPAPTKPAPTKPAPTKPAPTKPAPTKPAPTKPAPTKLAPTK